MKSVKLDSDMYLDSSAVVHNKKKLNTILDRKILYDNQLGSNELITLNDSLENYDYIEIYFAGVQGGGYNYDFSKVNNPNNKKVALSTIISGASNLYIAAARINLSETTITFENNRRVYWHNNSSAIFDDGALIYITKVIGYKY